jgi:UDP-2,3-diacylglucosamine pyrophosphatase LpxH
MVFGDVFKTYWASTAMVDIDAQIIDHLIRVVRRGKSIVFYTSSW